MKKYHHTDFKPTQEGFIAYVMVFDSRTRASAIAFCEREVKNFNKLPKGKVWQLSKGKG